jgi:hypothetical protein
MFRTADLYFSKFSDVAALVEVLLCMFCQSFETTGSQHFGNRNTFCSIHFLCRGSPKREQKTKIYRIYLGKRTPIFR